MIKITDKSKCSGCHACATICPVQCITMLSDGEGFWYPVVDAERCINCGKCEKNCPIVNPLKVENTPIAYAAYNTDEKVRLESSSGGVFALLAEYIIAQRGVVFGAGFNEKLEVTHMAVERLDDLPKLMGSKYVQSKIGNSYRKTKEYLDSGRLVLFTGTPCQIGGLKAYLGKDYDNLFCQDLICHGVPSPKVWRKYVTYQENRAGSPARRISFRRKYEGWKRYSVSLLFNNETEYHQTFGKDLMMTAFLKNACLRPSCYACAFKNLHRESDITLADFWGIQSMMPEMDDDKGTSLVIVNSEKGEALFQYIKGKLVCEKADLTEAIKFNPSMVSSVRYNPNRKNFFTDIDLLSFDKLVAKHCTDSYYIRGKRKVIGIMIKIKRAFTRG